MEKPSARVGENIAKWNAEKRFPPLVYASSTELFRAVERAPLPTYEGEMPSYWDMLQAVGHECLMADRRLDGRLLAAEKFSTFAGLLSPGFAYPREQLDTIWEHRLFVVEHNWGGANGEISDRVKTEKIREATALNDKLLASALRSISGAIRFSRGNAIPVVVFNPLSWDRKDIVICTLPVAKEKAGKIVMVDGDGRAIPDQLVRGDPAATGAVGERGVQVAFGAEVPSLGYATYYATTDNTFAPAIAPEPFQIDARRNRFENRFYRVVLDARTGGIKSFYDKQGRKELVRQDSRYACNELVAREDDEVDNKCHFTGKQWSMREQPSAIKVVEHGPVRLVVEVTGRVLDDSVRRQEIILYSDSRRVDLLTTLDWKGRKNVHLYQMFPLNLASPTVRYAVPYGWQELGKEMKYAAPWPFGPVAGYPSRGMRGWAEATEANVSVTLASECNMAAFRDLAATPETGCLIQPLLLRTVRSSGDDNLYYTQPGEHHFRFALQSHADSMRLGEEFNSPLLSCMAEAGPSTTGSLPERFSFAQVKSDHVQLAVVKQAEDGQGVILRLVETGGNKGDAPIDVQWFRPIAKAVKTNIIEENEEGLATQGSKVSLPIGPASIETLRIDFGSPGR